MSMIPDHVAELAPEALDEMSASELREHAAEYAAREGMGTPYVDTIGRLLEELSGDHRDNEVYEIEQVAGVLYMAYGGPRRRWAGR